MNTIQLQSEVGDDGILALQVPLGIAEARARVIVTIEPLTSIESSRGSVAAVRQAVSEPPHLGPADVDALNRAIDAGRMPLRHKGVFDEEDTQ